MGTDKKKDGKENNESSLGKKKETKAENIPAVSGEPKRKTTSSATKIPKEHSFGDRQYTLRKLKKKFVYTIFELLILVIIAFGFATFFVSMTTYKPYDKMNTVLSSENGFIALSYIGASRRTANNLFGEELLRRHLTVLKDLGYVTITQQDIIDYYQSGKALPEKALFLMFEDARRDTAIFSQKVLKELNFKATMLTLPERFLLNDPRFLTPEEVAELETTSFWEIGSEGYRYAFINVYDRYDNYFSEMNLFTHSAVAAHLELHLPVKRQNHYLMDYIRDQYGVPYESFRDMHDRISYDYSALRDIYLNNVKLMPKLHVLRHPTPGMFGDNKDVSAVNEFWIKNLFEINFNRSPFCINKPDGNIYDLTRMQPQAWWSVNHLLVRLRHDLNQDLDFIVGDDKKLESWYILKGAVEFQERTIITTSFPRDTSLLKLKNSDDFKDVHIAASLKGNRLGRQRIYLRADSDLDRFLAVSIIDNFLYVEEKINDEQRILFQLNLDRHDGIEPWSIPEDRKMAEINILRAFMEHTNSKERAKIYAEQIRKKELETVPSIEDGAPEFTPIIYADAQGDRKLQISLSGGLISINVDGKEAVTDLPVDNTQPGAFYIESGWSGKSWADEVYDGVFEDLLITENTGMNNKKKETVLFDIKPQGLDAVKLEAWLLWERILEFFVSRKI